MSSMQISQVLAEMRALQARASGISETPAAVAQPSEFANLMRNSVDHIAGMQNQATALADAYQAKGMTQQAQDARNKAAELRSGERD